MQPAGSLAAGAAAAREGQARPRRRRRRPRSAAGGSPGTVAGVRGDRIVGVELLAARAPSTGCAAWIDLLALARRATATALDGGHRRPVEARHGRRTPARSPARAPRRGRVLADLVERLRRAGCASRCRCR